MRLLLHLQFDRCVWVKGSVHSFQNSFYEFWPVARENPEVIARLVRYLYARYIV